MPKIVVSCKTKLPFGVFVSDDSKTKPDWCIGRKRVFCELVIVTVMLATERCDCFELVILCNTIQWKCRFYKLVIVTVMPAFTVRRHSPLNWRKDAIALNW